MDAVQKVGNGHPGTAMSLAPAAYLLFQKLLRHNPADWLDRSRPLRAVDGAFQPHPVRAALPAGYGLGGRPEGVAHVGQPDTGHPEHGHTAGVETTTSPLGQGVGNAVGMAMAARLNAVCSTRTPSPARASSTTTSSCSPATATSRRA